MFPRPPAIGEGHVRDPETLPLEERPGFEMGEGNVPCPLAVQENSSSVSVSTSSPTLGGSGRQAGEARFKQSSTTSTGGRLFGKGDRHSSNVSHRSSVNHSPSAPCGLPGRSPSMIFRMTIKENPAAEDSEYHHPQRVAI